MNDFHGLLAGSIENVCLRLDFLTTAGPRLVGLYVKGREGNLLAETPNAGWDTLYGPYRLYGGHRLWIAPEVDPDTAFPDNDPVAVERVPDGVRLIQRAESISGLTKSIEVRLPPGAPILQLTHTVKNDGFAPRELALWAITQLPLGGVALLPQPNVPNERLPLAPNRQLSLWPCSRWTDPRLVLGDALIQVRGESLLPPYKVGYLNRTGWIAYWMDDLLLIKRFETAASLAHADMGSNAEVFVNDRYVELETLGPLVCLEPGQTASHVERWEVVTGIDSLASALWRAGGEAG